MRRVEPLTDLAIRNAQPIVKPDGSYQAVWLHDGGGLYLQITGTPSGQIAKYWLYRYSVKGKDRRLGLGAYPTVSLSDARRLREQQRRLRKEQRLDPIAERRRQDQARALAEQEAAQAAAIAKARSVTFARAAQEYITAHRPEWKSARYHDQWKRLIGTYANPIIGDIPIADIDRDHVLQVLNPVWLTKTVTAKVLRGMIANILSWSANKSKPYRPAGPNPATWTDNLEHSLQRPNKIAKVKHRPALPWQDIRQFMAALRADNSVAAAALQFAILTTARTVEVRLTPWSEIDLKRRVWEIPALRMKADRPHRVPLSDAAVEILAIIKADTTPGKRDYVFAEPTGRPLADKALRNACHRIDPTVSVHGMRSTFRDWIGEATKFPRELAEIALAHKLRNATEEAYRRDDALEKRRSMMEAWARFCVPKTAKVIEFPAA
jgi:integrase